jgi:hypothetical protein
VLLKQYCDQTIEALYTGLFTYFAHPDIMHFVGEEAIYRQQMRRICRAAKECQVPLEINLLGLYLQRQYPNPIFWELAAEEGCKVVLGVDAHKPEFLLDEPYYDRFSAVIDVLCKDPSVVIMERQFGYDVGGEIFYHGNTLFTTATVSTTQNLRSAEFAGSIIPMPKYTEAQEHYMCSASDVYFTALCVPITVSDFDRTGYILDAMSYYGDEIIRPAAIDKQVLVKGVQDEDTEEMIRIIFDSKAVDLSFVTDWGGWPGIMHEFVKNAKNNLSSSEAKYTKRVNLAIRKSLEAFGLE